MELTRRAKLGALSSKFRYVSFDGAQHFDQTPKVHLLDELPAETFELTKEKGIQLYKDMHLIRRSERATSELYRKKLVRGFCHLYIGQEAVAVGVHAVMRPQDTITSTYRCHPWAILKTRDLVGFFGELLGNSVGFSRGKGGSMHLYADNLFGGNAIVGAQVPLGVGVALKHKYTNSDAISITTCGDGAFVQGQVSEALNIAKLQDFPLLLLVENNYYGMGTSTRRSSSFNEYYRWSASVPGVRANGMQVFSVIEATKLCFKHIHGGKGPIILEVMTYRYPGHSMSDPGTSYRTVDEIKKVRDERDCLKNLSKLLTESNLATEEELDEIRNANKKMINAALEEAKKSQPLPVEELTADCYTHYTGKIKLPKPLTEVAHKNKKK